MGPTDISKDYFQHVNAIIYSDGKRNTITKALISKQLFMKIQIGWAMLRVTVTSLVTK